MSLYMDLLDRVHVMREKNAVSMKARWDTVNTQKVQVGDFVLVDPRIKKKWRAKDVLGERIFSMPGKVIEVNANGNIRVSYKNGSVTPENKPVPNNKFKVVDEDLYNSVDMASILNGLDSSEESEEQVFLSFIHSYSFIHIHSFISHNSGCFTESIR